MPHRCRKGSAGGTIADTVSIWQLSGGAQGGEGWGMRPDPGLLVPSSRRLSAGGRGERIVLERRISWEIGES